MPELPLDVIKPDPGEVDPSAEREEEYYRAQRSYQLDKLRLDNERLQHELYSLRLDTDLRRQFARRIFILVIGWFGLVLLLLVVEGFKVDIDAHAFGLSDSVLLALIGTTTINIIAILLIVVHYLFPERHNTGAKN
ncbi:MAG: hypothetical protein JO166_03175 [Deltaproteobacteria bacterium]|nr:hypothetical protein [Deltaproteobacteria bacterium]